MTRIYPSYQMECPDCGETAESDHVDVGVGIIVRGNFACLCGWEYEADGKANVGEYGDWFPDIDTEPRCVNAHDRCYGGAGGPCPYCERPLVAPQQDGGEARSASYTYDKDGAVVGGITRGYYD